MSLTRFLKNKDIKKLLSDNFEKPKGKIGEIRIISNTRHPALIGTAFDYLMRFCLKYYNQNAEVEEWIAEKACKMLEVFQPEGVIAQNIIEFAKESYSSYLVDGKITDKLLKSTLQLAQLDVYYRSSYIPENIGSTDDGDIQELKKLIKLVNFDDFKAESYCSLNPTFGEASRLVMGADADIVIDNKIIDIKTVSSNYLTTEMFQQNIGYYLLGRIGGIGRNKIKGSTIEKIGFYFSRHGILKLYNIKDIKKNKTRIPYILTQFESIARKYNPILYQEDVKKNLDELYFDIWQSKISTLKSKKQVWSILRQTSEYSQSLNTFYKEVKNYSLEETIEQLNNYFRYSNILVILKICEIDNPDWDELGLKDEDKFKKIYYHEKVEANLKVLYFENWQSKISTLKSKKQVWSILGQTSDYSQSLNAFYKEVKNYSLEETIELLDNYFNFSNLLVILNVCEIKYPKWSKLGLTSSDLNEFKRKYAV